MRRDYLRTKYLIIGAGLSGLSAAYHIKENCLLIEANNFVGGIASTFFHNGFKLDNGVHVLYFRHKSSYDWIRNTLQVELSEKVRTSSVWLENSFVTFPIQYHLSELSFTSKKKSINSILRTLFHASGKRSNDFESYSNTTFGNYLTDIFIRPYNEKMFGDSISKMNIDWMGDYLPKYSRIKMLMSTTGLTDSKYGRNSEFYYPAEGGIASLAKKISDCLQAAPIFGSELMSLSLNTKTAKFESGLEINYEYLINSIPLKSFLQKVDDLPIDISDSAGLLKKNSTTLLHILVKGRIDKKEHWIYIPDPAIPFYRITIPGNINTLNCPDGYFAITLEFGGDVYKSSAVLKTSLSALRAMSILNDNLSEMEFHWKRLDCGYIIYDENRELALKKIFPFLQRNQIWSIGRYGSWEYSNMEDAILHGRKVAEQIIKQN
ncbi:MAG TPA: NAD(P)-binding protein [Ignavibacteriaceae bacterium]|nr:NAD(P)-binding protein [Ignavibacteriaceae bacterium]